MTNNLQCAVLECVSVTITFFVLLFFLIATSFLMHASAGVLSSSGLVIGCERTVAFSSLELLEK